MGGKTQLNQFTVVTSSPNPVDGGRGSVAPSVNCTLCAHTRADVRSSVTWLVCQNIVQVDSRRRPYLEPLSPSGVLNR